MKGCLSNIRQNLSKLCGAKNRRRLGWLSEEADMTDDFINFADKIGVRGLLDNPSIVPDANVKEENGFNFRPLTEEEKKLFNDAVAARINRDTRPANVPAQNTQQSHLA